MVYQEQIMQAAQIMAGFTLGSADLLRRAMGKKDMEEMQTQRATFVEGAKKKGIDEKAAEEVFTIMEKFAKYGFNRSHSAGYAVIAYQTAYLKANYTPEFMAATLSNYLGSIDDTQYYLNETKRFHIKILGPDINESDIRFVANKNGEIRFSLTAIKGIGEAAVNAIILERNINGPFKNLFDLTKRLSSRTLSKKAAESLAAAGAFDCWEESHRAQYFYILPGENLSAIEKAMRNAASDISKANGRMQTLFGETVHEQMRNPTLPVAEPWPPIAKLKREKEVTGVYLSGHPLDDYKVEMDNFCTCNIADLDNFKNQELSIGGIINAIEHRVSKNGKSFASFSIEDFTGSTEMVLFGEDYMKFKHFLTEGTLLFVKGKYQPKFNSDDRYELRITALQLLQDIRERLTKKVTMNIELADVNDQLISKIEDLFTKHKGNYPVAIQVNDPLNNYSINLNAQKMAVSLTEEFMSAINNYPEVQIKLC